MKFVDEVQIEVKAGKGGNGIASFRREKYIEFGGPDGGDGGDGGSIYLKGTKSLNTLADFRTQKNFEAQNGEGGMSKNKTGRKGDDLDILVPLGTIVCNADNGVLKPPPHHHRPTPPITFKHEGGVPHKNSKSKKGSEWSPLLVQQKNLRWTVRGRTWSE